MDSVGLDEDFLPQTFIRGLITETPELKRDTQICVHVNVTFVWSLCLKNVNGSESVCDTVKLILDRLLFIKYIH